MRKMFRKGHLMEALLVLASVAALLSTASGKVQVQQNTSTSITTYSSTTTATSYTLTTVLSTTVSTVSAIFLSSTTGWVTQATFTSVVATITNMVAQTSVVTYPVVTVFITVSDVTISILSGFDSTSYIWILLAVGIGLSAIVVLIVLVLVKLSPPPEVNCMNCGTRLPPNSKFCNECGSTQS